MFKKSSLLLVAVFFTIISSAQSIKWYNPQEAGFPVVQGQAFQNQERNGFYDRFPAKAKDVLRKKVWDLSRQSAGESIVFSTDSKEIKVRYKVFYRYRLTFG